MGNNIVKPRGTSDFLPDVTAQWQKTEQTLFKTASLYGFREIRVPTFEHTELFARGVGDTTDVVNKEMYTFEDKGGRSITLRPEGTAGICRAAIENGLLGDALPQKFSYLISCFRYEKPQSGRFREFHQFGIEMFGANSPVADAEVIALAAACLKEIGIKEYTLAINSIGCKECRAKYHEALKKYFENKKDQLCETCQERLEKNPMRILDCKSPVCKEICVGAPSILDYLCDDCAKHFEEVKSLLKASQIPFEIDSGIVRGLDYYTRTVFEFSIPGFPALCGGGRYGGLISELGGPELEGIGFAMGLERLMAALGTQKETNNSCDIYLAPIGNNATIKAFTLCEALRRAGFDARLDLSERSIKAQMKYANKIGAKYTVVIGDDEMNSGEAVLKDMNGGEPMPIKLDETLVNALLMKINQI